MNGKIYGSGVGENDYITKPIHRGYQVVVYLLALIPMVLFGFLLGARAGFFLGLGLYLGLTWLLKMIFQKHQTRGEALFRDGKYREALDAFRESYAYFQEHPRIDQFRCITMLSYSDISMEQKALVGMGECYEKLGQYDKALWAFETLYRSNYFYPAYVKRKLEEVREKLGI